ncbi:AP-4 complex subunit epsilon-1-like isoform X2 [Ornithodoros turicata]|uniref:AP-4 complex subunit epsilon-1-like isoform X2 n=1 Tax=Ornithodoros turicata TaxID=34597 RepID=UPI003138EA0C
MSAIMERTVHMFQTYLERNLRGDASYVQELVEIASAPTKEDEDHLLRKKLTALETSMKNNDGKQGNIEGCLLQAMYLEMLGYSASFAYIHAVKLLEQGNVKQKVLGYMAACTMLHSDHELVLLIVNTLQRDISSSVSLIVVAALEAIPKLIHGEMTTAFQAPVLEKTRHSSAIVRKAATFALHHCYAQSGVSTIPSLLLPPFKKALDDSDLRVVCSSIHSFCSLAESATGDLSHLYLPLEKVYAQLRQRTVGSEYEFGGIAMPWLQISILVTFSRLKLHTEQYNMLAQVLQRTLESTEVTHGIYYAIILEAVNTVGKVMSNSTTLANISIGCVSKMLRSNNANLNYCGVEALEHILSRCCPSEAVRCQDVIIDCLHHPDDSVRIKTLNLLVTMANQQNVTVIVNRIMKLLVSTPDESTQSAIVQKVLHLLDKYPGDVNCSTETFATLLFAAPHLVSEDIVFQFINGGAVGKLYPIVFSYCESNLATARVSALHFAIWVLGVSCNEAGEKQKQGTRMLLKLLHTHSHHSSLCINALSALMKASLVTKQPITDDDGVLLHLIEKTLTVVIKQRASELLNLGRLFKNNNEIVLHVDKKPGQLDAGLSFLDGYVSDALKNGAAPYKPKSQRRVSTQEEQLLISDVNTMTSSMASTAGSDESSAHQFLDSPSLASSESFGKPKLWSSAGRVREVKDDTGPASQTENVGEEPKMEDAELLKSLFSSAIHMDPMPSVNLLVEEDTNAQVKQAAEETPALPAPAVPRISQSEELWGIKVKKKSSNAD